MAQKAIVGEKVGMTQVWGDDQRVIPVTVLRVEPVRVVQVKTNDRDGYTALQVTYGHKNASKQTSRRVVALSSCDSILLMVLKSGK
jgi:large subunit ribosomal protein L3